MSVHQKKRGRGRPPGRAYGETIPVRLTEECLTAIDAWVERQDEEISRSEAIRRLIEHGLATQSAAAGRSIQEARATPIREARIALERALAVLARAEAKVSGKAGKRERE